MILRRLIERGVRRVGVATIWDPMAVTFCHAAGEGARLRLRFGGKAGAEAGEPIDADVEVLKAVDEAWQSFGPSRVTLGRAALVRIAGTEIDMILNTNRTQTFEPDVFTNLGVDPLEKQVLLIKSTNHFYAGFRADCGRDYLCFRADLLSDRSGLNQLHKALPADLAARFRPAWPWRRRRGAMTMQTRIMMIFALQPLALGAGCRRFRMCSCSLAWGRRPCRWRCSAFRRGCSRRCRSAAGSARRLGRAG